MKESSTLPKDRYVSTTALGFIGIFSLGLILALTVRPVFGLYTYIFEFYAHPPSRWWGVDLPGIRWSLLAAVITFLAVLIHHESKEIRKLSWYQQRLGFGLLLYVIWMWIQLPWVISEWHFEGAVLFTKYLVLFYLIHKLVITEKEWSDFALAHAIGCAYLGWLIFIAPDTGRLESRKREHASHAFRNRSDLRIVSGSRAYGLAALVYGLFYSIYT